VRNRHSAAVQVFSASKPISNQTASTCVVWPAAAIAVILQALDLLSGIRMMLVNGVDLEQNPIARTIFMVGGPIGLTAAKFGVVGCAVVVLIMLARAGRPRLARNALIVAALLGILGFASNLV
jgi:hypothetical protein